jgi:hypothetical protein
MRAIANSGQKNPHADEIFVAQVPKARIKKSSQRRWEQIPNWFIAPLPLFS